MCVQNEENSNFCPKSVAEFLDGKHIFVIPSYQRGYRWEKKQVIDLLEDIYEFSKSGQDSCYYLQPLVVKRCKWRPNGNEEEVDAWEVLDGQQRLTTLRLILLYIFEKGLMDYEKDAYSLDKIYKIDYTNRPKLDFEKPEPRANIDSYYLYTAKNTIDEWFKDRVAKGIMNPFKQCLMYENNEKNEKKVKFIWYEMEEKKQTLESIQVFNRLNKGKISLTSSELIKALFIMDIMRKKEQVAGDNKIKADELVLDFNEMERQFQNDKFWYFISNSNDTYQTRIDVLFDFLTEKPKDNHDNDYAYRKFQNLFDRMTGTIGNANSTELDDLWQKKGIDSMQKAWEEVSRTYNSMLAWYEDDMYYHYVGFLVSMGDKPREIYNYLSVKKLSKEEWTKDDTKRELRKKIMENFKNKNDYLKKDDIEGLEYGSEFVPRILLLFNVESCLKKGQRFDFDSYKKEQWDIEHISSQSNASLVEHEDRLRWLENVKYILEIESKLVARKEEAEKLLKECGDLIPEYNASKRGIEKQYEEFSKKALGYFSAENDKINNIDNLGNLTLLDYRTNREYQDAPFPYKRYRIIEEDKEGRRFIPVGTRNVFLKYYTNSDLESSFIDALRWTQKDAKCYLEEIHKIVDPIFEVVENKEPNTNE